MYIPPMGRGIPTQRPTGPSTPIPEPDPLQVQRPGLLSSFRSGVGNMMPQGLDHDAFGAGLIGLSDAFMNRAKRGGVFDATKAFQAFGDTAAQNRKQKGPINAVKALYDAGKIPLSDYQAAQRDGSGAVAALILKRVYGEDSTRPTAPKVISQDIPGGGQRSLQWDEASQKWVPLRTDGSPATNLDERQDLTESQSKLTLFKSLQDETHPVLVEMEKSFNPGNLPDQFSGNVLGGNFFRSQQGQQYEATATAWAEGALRIATGAAATPEEMIRTKKAYFAQPGDTQSTIAYKARLREMYSRAIQRGLGYKPDGSLATPMDFAEGKVELPEGETIEDIIKKHRGT